MLSYSRSHLANPALLRSLSDVVAKDRTTTAEMLALIAEVDRRRLYAGAGFESMYVYCVGHLRMSEDAAYKRIRAARASRRFPSILEAIGIGRLSLSAVVLLARHLRRISPEAGTELLSAAEGKSRSELELLLAERFPQPDVPSRVQQLPPQGVTGQLAPGPVQVATDGLVPTADAGPAPQACAAQTAAFEGPQQLPGAPAGAAPATLAPASSTPALTHPRLTPLSPGRFAVQLTMSQQTHDKLRYAQSLLGHAVPSGELAEVLDRALDALIANLEKHKFAAAERPRKSRGSSNERHIPAAIKRAVWKRDGGRCTYVSEDDHRCDARKLLEYDHEQPLARGGRTSLANLRLRCRTHNQLEAERTFGAGFMEAKRERVQ
jgi:5-methylcytosine-specific restriction endonuclease McrA